MFKQQVPPGPRSHFLIGDFLAFNRDPLAFLTRYAREYGDVVELHLLNRPTYLINRPDYIEDVLVTHNHNFIKSRGLRESRSVLGTGLLTSEGEFWRRQRRLIQPAFHRNHIAAYGDVMVAYTQRMLATWRSGEIRDIHQDMMRLTLEIVAKTLFDTDVAGEAQEVGEAMRVVLEHFNAQASTGFLIPNSLPTPGNRRMRQAVQQLDAIIYNIIRQRRTDGTERGDLLSTLLEAHDEDGSRMTDKQLRDEVMTLFLAGHETTAIALSWTWHLLSQHPEAEARLWTELRSVLNGRAPTVTDLPQLRYTEWVVNESLRLYPPAWVIGREAVRECEIGRYTLPAGSTIVMSQWVMHRDPRYFKEPERFKPERWANDPSSSSGQVLAKHLPRFAYFPFGGGPRQCIGNSFALMEARLLLATIAPAFRLVASPGPEVTPWPTITLRPRHGMWMELRKR